jgi:hypothetical protein
MADLPPDPDIDDTVNGAGPPSPNRTPRWVRLSWVILLAVALLVLILLLIGGHGPSRHL